MKKNLITTTKTYSITTQGFQIENENHESDLRSYADSFIDYLNSHTKSIKSTDYLHITLHHDYTIWGFAFTLKAASYEPSHYQKIAQRFLNQDDSSLYNRANAFIMGEDDDATLYIHLYTCN